MREAQSQVYRRDLLSELAFQMDVSPDLAKYLTKRIVDSYDRELSRYRGNHARAKKRVVGYYHFGIIIDESMLDMALVYTREKLFLPKEQDLDAKVAGSSIWKKVKIATGTVAAISAFYAINYGLIRPSYSHPTPQQSQSSVSRHQNPALSVSQTPQSGQSPLASPRSLEELNWKFRQDRSTWKNYMGYKASFEKEGSDYVMYMTINAKKDIHAGIRLNQVKLDNKRWKGYLETNKEMRIVLNNEQQFNVLKSSRDPLWQVILYQVSEKDLMIETSWDHIKFPPRRDQVAQAAPTPRPSVQAPPTPRPQPAQTPFTRTGTINDFRKPRVLR